MEACSMKMTSLLAISSTKRAHSMKASRYVPYHWRVINSVWQTLWRCAANHAVPLCLLACGARTGLEVETRGDEEGPVCGVSDSSPRSGCNAFADASSVQSIPVHFRNQSPFDIYLPRGACDGIAYGMVNEGDEVTYPGRRDCSIETCEELRGTSVIACSCLATAHLLKAGGSITETWDGLGVAQVAMPRNCYGNPVFVAETCAQLVCAAPGTYHTRAVGYQSCPECNCDAGGLCFGEPQGAQAVAEVTTFTMPDASAIDIVFGACAFGC